MTTADGPDRAGVTAPRDTAPDPTGPADAAGPDAAGPGDDALVVDLAAGDHDALAELYRRHGGVVWGVARRVCNDRTLAEDVTQIVFVDLWRRPNRFDPARGRLRPWLVAQAHARAVDAVRSESARQRRHEHEGTYAAPPAPDVESAAHVAALSHDVRLAVGQLAAEERDAIVLAYFGGHSYRETAALLGAPEGTVKSRIRRGMLGLRRVLEAQGMTP